MNTTTLVDSFDKFRREQAIDYVLGHPVVRLEFVEFVLGKYLGCGCSRYVFEYKLDPSYVVKIERDDRNANVLEWNVWDHVKDRSAHSKWFAPLKSISECGRIMLQKKCNTNFKDSKLPLHIPNYFTDVKRDNWGMYKGRLVCFDYALHTMLENGITTRMQKANWNE